MDYSLLGPGKKAPKRINVVIENPTGSRVKYEFDEKTHVMKAKRILDDTFEFPVNYGFVPETLADDGDPVDILLLSDEKFVTGSYVEAIPIGMLEMEDEYGEDNKVLAVPKWDLVTDYEQVPSEVLDSIETFFTDYKKADPKRWSKVYGWKGSKDAKKYIEKGIENYTN